MSSEHGLSSLGAIYRVEPDHFFAAAMGTSTATQESKEQRLKDEIQQEIARDELQRLRHLMMGQVWNSAPVMPSVDWGVDVRTAVRGNGASAVNNPEPNKLLLLTKD